VFEIRQRISEEPLTVCEVCGGHVRRLLSAAPFILKGGGWYVTDYPSQSRKKAMESEKSSTAAPVSTDKSGDTKSGETKSGETKSSEKSAPAPAPSASPSPSAPAAKSTAD
jgi:putative FmdB family regulatory protein